MAGHTEGAWTRKERRIFAEVEGRPIPIATVELFIVPDEPGIARADIRQCEANGDLMAVAPKLLEACELAASKLDYMQTLWSREAITERVVATLHEAIKAARCREG